MRVYREVTAGLLMVMVILAVSRFAIVEPVSAQAPAPNQAEVGGSVWGVVKEAVKEWPPVVQALATTAVVIGGVFFARRSSQIFRARAPHVIVSHEVTHRLVGTQYVHIFVTAMLNNSSRVHIEFLDGFSTIRQVRPVEDADVERLYEQVYVDKSFANLQWSPLDSLRHSWEQDGLLVEPGEIETEIFEFIVERSIQSVAITTYFYNARVVGKIRPDMELDKVQRRKRRFLRWLPERGPMGWDKTTVYDIVREQ